MHSAVIRAKYLCSQGMKEIAMVWDWGLINKHIGTFTLVLIQGRLERKGVLIEFPDKLHRISEVIGIPILPMLALNVLSDF